MSSWEEVGNYLVKKYEFKTFVEALEFVNKVGYIAESLQHHPDIFIHDYKFVKISTSTHSEGKITDKDWELVKHIDGEQ